MVMMRQRITKRPRRSDCAFLEQPLDWPQMLFLLQSETRPVQNAHTLHSVARLLVARALSTFVRGAIYKELLQAEFERDEFETSKLSAHHLGSSSLSLSKVHLRIPAAC